MDVVCTVSELLRIPVRLPLLQDLEGFRPMLAATASERASNVEQAAVKEYECPICLSYAAPPIMMCQSSHIVCNSCWKKCISCPTCRAPKTLTRALALESLYSLLTIPCRYDGCTFRSNGAFTPLHEQSCKFFPITCPLSDAFDCTWRGPIGHSKKHLVTYHKANVYFEPNIRLVSTSLGNSHKKNYSIILCCYGGIFRFSLEYDRSISSNVQFNMVQINSRGRDDKFRYILKFFHQFHTRNAGCVVAQAMVTKLYNQISLNEIHQPQIGKWILQFTTLLSYCAIDNGDFYYEVDLQKCFRKNIKRKPSSRRCIRLYGSNV